MTDVNAMADFTRRRMLLATLSCAGALACSRSSVGLQAPPSATGYVIGEPTAAKVGARTLADGGNAVDAIVAAALAATVAAPHQTGIGGYGAHGVFAIDGGKTLWALDANSAAPQAMRADTFRLDAQGNVPGRINELGWLAAGVPGILAGLQLALDRCGTQSFGDVVQGAIEIARDGCRLPATVIKVIENSKQLRSDPGSQNLYYRGGSTPKANEPFTNPRLADMLTTLAQHNSVDAFYRGEFASQIAEAFQQHDGLLTKQDLGAYRARLTPALSLSFGDKLTLHTAPLTAGGLTVLQVLHTLATLDWRTRLKEKHASRFLLEAARLAWSDRLAFLGDPEFVDVPQAKLLSTDYAGESADRVRASVDSGRPLQFATREREHGGTIHLSAADRDGNFAALTLTHGGSFGAQVTVDGIGLTLGHGMSRFDPQPDHPNAPGPGKRPLNNMVPAIVTRGARAVLAVGGRGGRKIPNAMLAFLAKYIFEDTALDEALAAPRLHTEGTTNISLEKTWPEPDRESLAQFGYKVTTAGSATLSAVALDRGALVSGMR